jgi:outer membrane protein
MSSARRLVAATRTAWSARWCRGAVALVSALLSDGWPDGPAAAAHTTPAPQPVATAPDAGTGGVLTLDDVVRLALERNVELAASGAAVEEAAAAVTTHRATLLPQVDAGVGQSWSGSRTRSDSGADTPERTVTRISRTTSPSVTARVPLFDPALLPGLSASRATLEAARLDHADTRVGISYEARLAHHELMRAVMLAEVAGVSLRAARDSEARVRALLRVGSVSASDRLKAEQHTAQAVLDSLNARQRIVVRTIALANLLGLPEERVRVAGGTMRYRDRTYDPDSLLELALSSRPDLAAAAARVRAAEASARAARGARWPALSASGSAEAGTRSTATTRESGLETTGRERGDITWSGRVALDWTVFDGGAGTASVRAADARLASARARHAQLELQVWGELREALQGYREAQVAGDVATRRLASSEESVRLLERRYDIGSATILELVDAQVELQSARAGLVGALIDLEEAAAAITRACGRES